MNPIAHVTLGCGAIWAGARLLEVATDRRLRVGPAAPTGDGASLPDAGAGASLGDKIDYRFVALGALLPDLVDKPIGKILFRGALNDNGHIFGHTLLFAILILVPGIFLVSRHGDPRVLAAGLAVLTHLLTDPVAHAPQNLLWPLLGSEFARVTLLGSKATVATEAAAALIVALVLWSVARHDRLSLLLRRGRL